MNLHIHSQFSDGAASVKELVDGLCELNVGAFSLTDHDCVDGNGSAEALAKTKGLKFVHGVELSCRFDGEIGLDGAYTCHIVGLNIDSKKMKAALERIGREREKRMCALIVRLIEDGFDLEPDLLEGALDGTYVRGPRTVICKKLVAKGYAATNDECYQKILNEEKYLKFVDYKPTIMEGINLIKSCGGVSVWAHPFGITKGKRLEIGFEDVKKMSRYMRLYGLDAVETYYQKYSKEQIEFLITVADGFNEGDLPLLRSIGTDFHAFGMASHRDSPDKVDTLAFGVEGVEADVTPLLGRLGII